MNNRTVEYVGIGYCCNDHLCLLDRIPVDGKTEIRELIIQGGGPAADAVTGAARLGLAAAYAGSIGDDGEGRKILEDFAADGVDASAVIVRPGGKSPLAYCWITPDGKRSVAWTKNGLELMHADEIPVEMIRRAKILHLDGHHPDAAVAAAAAAKRSGCLVALDAGTFTPRIEELLALADILIASEAFAEKFAGTGDVETALGKLAQWNARAVAVTMGDAGSAALDNGRVVRCPAFTGITVRDTTGAGDAYHCGFEFRYLQGAPIADCMRFGSAVAALKCRLPGARAGLPTLNQVEEFLQQRS